jgi:hypothetical protein
VKSKRPLKASTPKEYIAALPEPRRTEVAKLDKLIRKLAPELKPFIHAGLLAFGPIHYTYATGREGDWFKIGISTRTSTDAGSISLYACASDERGYVAERYKGKFPKAKVGRSCVRFKKLEDLDGRALSALIKETARTGLVVGLRR